MSESGTLYQPVSVDTFSGILTDAGMPVPFVATLAGVDVSIEKGELAVLTGDLSRLIGCPTTPIADSIPEALEALEG